jgi:acyl carrier protein
MDNDAALNLVTELVAEMAIGATPAANITESATLRQDLGLSSLNLLILLVRVQERTGVELAAQSRSVSSFQTVGDVVRVVVGGP